MTCLDMIDWLLLAVLDPNQVVNPKLCEGENGNGSKENSASFVLKNQPIKSRQKRLPLKATPFLYFSPNPILDFY